MSGVLAAAPALADRSVGFEPNRGQVSEKAEFRARGLAYSAFLTRQGPVVVFRQPSRDAFAYQVGFLGAADAALFSPINPTPAHRSYFVGGSPSFKTNVYERVRQQGVYPGIDVVYKATGRALEYDFIVSPGADPAQIALEVQGPDSLSIDSDGRLVMASPLGDFFQLAPKAFQETDSGTETVAVAYRLAEDGTVAFTLGEYDREKTLVIDPVLDYSTYLGAGDGDFGNAVAVGEDGSIYVAGRTDSSDFPISSGVFLDEFGGDSSDAFITKFNADGTLGFSTFYGSEGTDFANDIAVGSDGSIYIAGQTESEGLPVDGFDGGFSGEIDCFVAKFSSNGESLEYATYLGDGDEDVCNAIAVNDSGEAIVAGYTTSLDFPATDDATQNVNMGGRDAFVAKLSATGGELLYATFLGGGGDDTAYDIAIDADGVHYVVGDTASGDFPVSDDAQGIINRSRDAFLAVISADGSSVDYSSFLSGSEIDFASAVAVGDDGTIAVVGETLSTDFPTLNATQRVLGRVGDEDAFLAVFTDMGRETKFTTFLGGEDRDFASDVAIDASGRIYVTGGTDSDNFPTSADALLPQARGDRDAFVAQFNAAGDEILFSTFFGGEDDDEGSAIAVSSSGKVYVAGFTRSNNFPMSDNAFQTDFNDFDIGGLEIPSEAFVIQLSDFARAETSITIVSSASFGEGPVANGSIVSAFGEELSIETEAASAVPLPTELAETQVRLTDVNGVEYTAELFLVSPEQINFVLPDTLPDGELRIELIQGGAVVASGTVQVQAAQPGIFTANQSGAGLAAAFVVQVVNAEGVRSLVFDSGPPVEAVPIDLSLGEAAIELYGTGIRGSSNVTATVDGQEAEVLFAGPNPDFVGLDQVNVRIPQDLAGKGEVDIVITVDGIASNTVTVTLQ